MHIEARRFTEYIKSVFSKYFNNKIVLDVGSGDINGNNKFLFDNCIYEGNDVIKAANVTIVSKTKDLKFDDEYFDTIISTECFEHDPEYIQSISKIYKMLKKGGLFIFTCASINRQEHGTRRTSPGCSYGTIGNLEDMQDYYKNLTLYDINKILNLNNKFTIYKAYYNYSSCDLYFIGIKKDVEKIDIDINYNDDYVIEINETILYAKINELNNQIKQKDNTISELQNQINQKDNTINELQNQLHQKDNIIYNLNDQLHQKDNMIYNLQNELSQLNTQTEQVKRQNATLFMSKMRR